MKTILTAKSKRFGSTEFVGEHLTLWLRGTPGITEKLMEIPEHFDEGVCKILAKALEDIGSYYEKLLKK